MIAVIDYGMGNLRSVSKALELVGGQVIVTSEPADIVGADAVVLPGVGAFGHAMDNLLQRDLVAPITESIASGTPFLGICLGLQLLFDESEEDAGVKGLGIIPGSVRRFNTTLKVPHMGWNELSLKKEVPVLKNTPDGSFMYFVHSYYVDPKDTNVVAATTCYDREFVSAIATDNVFATQFHPEKSAEKGLAILKEFCELVGPASQ